MAIRKRQWFWLISFLCLTSSLIYSFSNRSPEVSQEAEERIQFGMSEEEVLTIVRIGITVEAMEVAAIGDLQLHLDDPITLPVAFVEPQAEVFVIDRLDGCGLRQGGPSADRTVWAV